MLKRIVLVAAVLFVARTADASQITLSGILSAANENPTNSSLGTGSVTAIVDNVALTIDLTVIFSGLTGGDTAAHIHCCVAQGGNTGVATAVPVLPGFPMGVTSGSFIDQTFSLLDAAFYNPAFISANGGSVATAEPVFLTGLLAGQSYFNIHTQLNGGGEIRAFLVRTPEPSTMILMSGGLAALLLRHRRSRNARS
jgi:hypothetical protein